MTKESKALAAFLSSCMDGDMSGDNMKKAMAEYAKQPAWHDAPTEPGVWLCEYRNSFSAVVLNDYGVKNFDANEMAYCRWYGPIPQEGEKS